MKIAVSGKGGVGKSTVAASIALILAQRGERVLALDADPDANLAAALGIPKTIKIKPVSSEIALIEERTGAKVSEYGQVFKLNPEVSDLTEKLALKYNGVELLVLGAIKKGGSGCACPESNFIRAFVNDLVLYKNETLIMDMEAGIEHLGRATATGVDIMLVVVEPGQRSIDCARLVARMAGEIGIRRLVFAANKVASPADEDFIRSSLKDCVLAGNPSWVPSFVAVLPFSDRLRNADRDGLSVFDSEDESVKGMLRGIYPKLLEQLNERGVAGE